MLKIGADPELFVFKDGLPVSGHEFPCGTKDNPRKTRHGHVQVDGTSLEINIRPATSKHAFIVNLGLMLKDLQAIVRKQDRECELRACPVAEFGYEYLADLPYEARKLGCEPDFSAYTGVPNYPPDINKPFRTGAGHVHLGWTEDADPFSDAHFEKCQKVVRELDFFLGLPSLKWDRESKRRELYGKAGAFRPKSYGVEYRVLSSAWVMDKHLAELVYIGAKRAYQNIHKDTLQDQYGDFAQKCINEDRFEWDTKAPKLASIIL